MVVVLEALTAAFIAFIGVYLMAWAKNSFSLDFILFLDLKKALGVFIFFFLISLFVKHLKEIS